MDTERSSLSRMMELYDRGTLSAQEFDKMLRVAKDMTTAFNMSMEEAYDEITKVHKGFNTFVDDSREPTEEEVAIHLSEVDDLEDAIAQLEAD